MQLPYSDELNIGYLSRLFDKTTNCYKFFWFNAILEKLDGKCNRFSFDEIINEMIANAWYMVTEYHLHLGPFGITDNLEEVVKYIHSEYGFRPSEKKEKILQFLQTTRDKRVAKYKADLILNVPYRLQVPFYDEIIIEKRTWSRPKDLIDEINCQRRLMYYFAYFAGLNTEIVIDSLWGEYLFKHKEILKSWTKFNLIHYLQGKNPGVPGIADKIETPRKRDIERARTYWKLIVQVDPTIKDIYGDVSLADVSISIDHFVPWQYVAHDELWNLHPTTKSINSSKGNLLPSWETYYKRLGEIEYRAYELKSKNDLIAHEFEKIAPYHLNNQEIRNQLYTKGLSRDTFIEHLEHVIKPVYESAQTMGFKEWVYSG